ncbi:MAG: hypothetical protein K0S33_2723 [Bacteroidetes bacterium]|jgi:hypothetical protein|nr:hypothetical protein [Bacteroidota bacterium]
MNKKDEIKVVVHLLLEKKKITSLSTAKIDSIVDTLSVLSAPTRDEIRTKISSGDYLIKESIDFSDTDYLIDMIADIINKK